MFAEVGKFLLDHEDVIAEIAKAVASGSSKEELLAAIRAALKVRSGAQFDAELAAQKDP